MPSLRDKVAKCEPKGEGVGGGLCHILPGISLLKERTLGSLQGANKYKCPKEHCLVRAAKSMAIEVAPTVLCIQLKRFEFSVYGQKVVKKVNTGPPRLLAALLLPTRLSTCAGHLQCPDLSSFEITVIR